MFEVSPYHPRTDAGLAQPALAVEGIQSVIAVGDAGDAYPFDLTGGVLSASEADVQTVSAILAEELHQPRKEHR